MNNEIGTPSGDAGGIRLEEYQLTVNVFFRYECSNRYGHWEINNLES